MKRAARERRTPRRVISVLAASTLVAGMLAALAPGAGAAGTKRCWVKNTTLAKSYGPAMGSVLQGAIDAAEPGNTLDVRGRCIGNFWITKDLTLVGRPKPGYPVATLDANSAERQPDAVLQVASAPVITLTDLLITNGSARSGAGISNYDGTLTLNGSTQVSGNTATFGGGIFNYGTINLNDSAQVNGNTALSGGGLFNYGTINLNDLGQANGNTATSYGGGIFNWGTINLNGSAQVNLNTAAIHGGGIYNSYVLFPGGSTTNLNGSAQVNLNTAAADGGGIYNYFGTLSVNDLAQVDGNDANHGGGIYNFGTTNLNGSAQVNLNTAATDGGGILRCGADTLNGASDGVNVKDNVPNNISVCS
jgi:hypothetical protein